MCSHFCGFQCKDAKFLYYQLFCLTCVGLLHDNTFMVCKWYGEKYPKLDLLCGVMVVFEKVTRYPASTFQSFSSHSQTLLLSPCTMVGGRVTQDGATFWASWTTPFPRLYLRVSVISWPFQVTEVTHFISKGKQKSWLPQVSRGLTTVYWSWFKCWFPASLGWRREYTAILLLYTLIIKTSCYYLNKKIMEKIYFWDLRREENNVSWLIQQYKYQYTFCKMKITKRVKSISL